jgi:signal peptidase I
MPTSRSLRVPGGARLAAAGAVGAAGAAGAVLALGWARRNLVVVTVHGTSMLPTLRDGDRVLVRRRSLDEVRCGDVVVLEPPLDGPYRPGPAGPDGRIWNVKRVAALPGDELPSGVPGRGRVASGAPGGGRVRPLAAGDQRHWLRHRRALIMSGETRRRSEPRSRRDPARPVRSSS